MAEALREIVSACIRAMNDDRGLVEASEIAGDPSEVDGGTPAHFQEQHDNMSEDAALPARHRLEALVETLGAHGRESALSVVEREVVR